MEEIRCGQCNKLLAKGRCNQLEIKCPRCRTISQIRTESPIPERLERQGNEHHERTG
ncbi:MAG: Com family DNA-binding transcriptional regulator [Magnetococcales bacterium]|nr:Com family DNA-binding transcriptional regulator [Magnetococcales bacterium]